jgi:hypothetical protein
MLVAIDSLTRIASTLCAMTRAQAYVFNVFGWLAEAARG